MPWLYTNKLLELVSRSFALCIPRLPKQVRREVGNYYLLCRYLDSIEDSKISRSKKSRAFKRFLDILEKPNCKKLEKLNEEILPFVLHGHDAKMVRGFAPVLTEFTGFDAKSKKIALRWIAVMAKGMKRFSHQKIRTFSDLDAYCYYVAGTVGHYLTDIFAHKFGVDRFSELTTRCRDFGLLLQKVNIIRDFSKDFQEGRVFWPSELFEKHKLKIDEAFDPKNKAKSQRVLSEMVGNAQKHYEKSVEYIAQIPAELQGLRLFCAIPLYMAMPTLYKCRHNPAIFQTNQKVKLSRMETVAIIRQIKKNVAANKMPAIAMESKRN